MTALVEPFTPWLRDINRFVSSETQATRFVPPADVLVTDDGVTVHMDVPGIRPDALEVELENDVLTVRGERPYPYADGDRAVKRIERGFGRFERTLRVPQDLDPNAIEASMTDGVLSLRLPKPESLKPRKIQIQAEEQTRQLEGATTT
jgi:HSP20 family protein